MGTKGSKLSSTAVTRADEVVKRMGKTEDLSRKRMFGGVGVFVSGRMFAIVDSAGALFFREGPGNRSLFEAAGAARHAKMPYRSVPESVWADSKTLAVWARAAIAATQGARPDSDPSG